MTTQVTCTDLRALKLDERRTFDLEKLLDGSFSPSAFVTAGKWRDCNSPGRKDWELILIVANSIMKMHGIEPLIANDKLIATYVNTGESYTPTVLYDHANQKFVVTSWGDFLEQWQAKNLIEVSLADVSEMIHFISHSDYDWEGWTDGRVEDYDSAEEWLESASMDIRLRVQEDGEWTVLVSSPDFDSDHRGAWGSSSVGKCQSLDDCRDIARDLIGQAADDTHPTKTITIIED